MTKQLPLPAGCVAFGTREPETVVLKDLDVAIHGQGFPTVAVTDDLSLNYPEPVPGLLNIGVLHTSADGRADHATYAPCSVDALVAHGYDYWALGHVHSREVLHADPWVVFPGNLQGRSARETGAKGATLVTVEDGRITDVEHRELAVVRWASCVADVSDCSTPDEVAIAVVEALQGQVDAADSCLVAARVKVQGATDAHGAIERDPEQLIATLQAHAVDIFDDRLWIEKVHLQTRPKIDIDSLRERDDATGEVLRTVAAVNDETLSVLAAGFTDLKAKLPHGVGVDPTDPIVLREALHDVERLLVAHLEAGSDEQDNG